MSQQWLGETQLQGEVSVHACDTWWLETSSPGMKGAAVHPWGQSIPSLEDFLAQWCKLLPVTPMLLSVSSKATHALQLGRFPAQSCVV